MTFFEAALRVLHESGGGPLHVREIARRAIDAGYLTSTGSTPEASLAAQLYVHVKRMEALGTAPRVKRVGRGQFALSTGLAKGPLKVLEDHNSSTRKTLLDHLSKMHPKAFENLVGELLSAIGFDNVSVTKYSGDGGLDVEAELTVGGVTNVRTAVQVKRWQHRVAGKTVRELRGSLKTDQRGLIITTSDYTKDAKSEASAEGKAFICQRSLKTGHGGSNENRPF